MLLSMITNLKYLAPASTIANICMGTGMVLTFYFLFQDLPPLTERRAFGNLKDLPLFFGTAIFAFEGIALVRFFQKNVIIYSEHKADNNNHFIWVLIGFTFKKCNEKTKTFQSSSWCFEYWNGFDCIPVRCCRFCWILEIW